VNVDVLVVERGQPRHVDVMYWVVLGAAGEGRRSCSSRHAIQDQTQRAQLFLHSLLICLVHLAEFAVEEISGQAVTAFLQIADGLDVAPVPLVVEVGQQVPGLEIRR
jgi:hypothetical protein